MRHPTRGRARAGVLRPLTAGHRACNAGGGDVGEGSVEHPVVAIHHAFLASLRDVGNASGYACCAGMWSANSVLLIPRCVGEKYAALFCNAQWAMLVQFALNKESALAVVLNQRWLAA